MANPKHRAEDQPDGKSTSEKIQGGASRGSTGAKHELAGDDTQVIKTAGSDLPARDGNDHSGGAH